MNSTQTPTRRADPPYREVRIDFSDQPKPRVGDTVFLAEIRHADRRADYTVMALTPYTNMSREEKEYGWLGGCNDHDAYAIGRGVVVDGVVTYHGFEPYQSVMVHMIDDGPDTWVPVNEFGHPLPIRRAAAPATLQPLRSALTCPLCSPDAVHASEAAEAAAIDDAEHARIQCERDAEDAEMTAAINAEVTRRGLSRPGMSITFMRVRA